MWRGGRMKNSLESVSTGQVAPASAQKKLFSCEGESEYPLSPVKRTAKSGNSKDVGSRIKRGAATGSANLLMPTPGRSWSKKTTSTPPPKAHHHRRSPSENAATTTAYCSSGTTSKQALRQSASFSGGISTASAQRPSGGRPPTSSGTSCGAGSAPRSSNGNLARLGSGPITIASSRRRILAPHNLEVEDDGAATWCQQSDHNVQVFIRSRPVSDAEIAQQGQFARCVRQENAHTVSWLGQPETRFTFDHVADESVTQEELFHVAGMPMVDNCMAGYNSCMFAYGQTGSGKTHTMLGDIGDCENRGMTPRVFEYLFAKIRKEEEAQKQGKLKYKCRCSFLEIYNEQISDLLEPSSTNLQMREDGKKGVFVEGLLEVEVQTVEEVLHFLLLGATNRKVAATHMNKESSRSHSVFTCVVESQWECDSMVNFRFGRLNLVDLAGSERQKDIGVDEERLREAASINKSLSTLGLVIMVLVDIANGKQRHVPYRDSKLTFLLQDSLGGNSKTTIIANISPSSCASSETLSTLKFAQRAKFIQNNAVVNEGASGDLKGLQEQIQQLKVELALVRRQSIGNPVPTPAVLNHKIKAMEALLVGVLRREKLLVKTSAAEIEHLELLVKQREDETCFHKSFLRSQEPEIWSEACDAKESSSELELMCNNLDHLKLAAENMHLQKRIRRCQECDAFDERETMVQDISNSRNKLLDMLDTKLSMDTEAAILQLTQSSPCQHQQEALVAELASERQATDQLRNEVETCQRELSECELKLQTSLDSNERIASELDALRLELERSRDECKMHKRELEALQLKKALEFNCWELKQAQHQQFVLELTTQLLKSEEKVAQERMKRSQIELQLQDALQESTNLQTELQWTRDSLEEAEAVVEAFQRTEPVLEIGDPEAAYEAFMVGQLQAEIIEMHARLAEERRHRRELENQIKSNSSNLQEPLHTTSNDRQPKTKSCKGRRKVRHQEAILQLQLELDSVDGGASLQSIIINQLQLDMETLNGALAEERQHLAEEKASTAHLRQQLEDLTQAKLKAENALNFVESSADLRTTENGKELPKLQPEWEVAALRMFDHLLEQYLPSLKLETVFFEDPLKHDAKHNILIQRLLHAQMLANSADKKFHAISDLMLNCIGSWPESGLQTYQNMKATKKNLEDCNGKLREFGQRFALVSTMEWWMSETATLVTWGGKGSRLDGEKELLEIQVQSCVELLENILTEFSVTEAQIQHQIKWKEEERAKLKEQAAEAQERWVPKIAELVEATREPEDRCVKETQTMQRTMLKRKDSETMMQLRESHAGNTTTGLETMDNSSPENDIHLLRNEGASHLAIPWLGEEWNNVAARDFTTSKIVVLRFPSGKVKVELARTHVLLTASEEKVKLLTTMVAKSQKNDHLEGRSDLKTSSSMTLNVVPREVKESDILKALVFSLDSENADLQHQLLETEADSTALKSTIANLQRDLQEKSEEVAALVAQLHVSDRHVFKLECQSVELREGMRRQAVAFGVLYEQFQKQGSLQEERAELMACRENARQLQSQVEGLQQELERMQPLRNEMGKIYEELHSLRTSTAIDAQRIEQLRSLVEDLERNRGQLQQEAKRKQSAIEALEKRVLVALQHKLQCQEDLHRCKEMAEEHKIRAREKQVEVEILGKSVEELENTVYALESQVGLLKKEGDRQRLLREDMESELQVLKRQNATVTEASSTRGGGVRRESSSERKLKEGEGKKLERYQMGSHENASFPLPKNLQKGKKNAMRIIGSAFRCFNMNHQVHTELDDERKSFERRILELEGVLDKHQDEVTVLKEKLDDVERVARDSLRVQRGVKVGMDEDLERVISQLNAFIKQRESRKQAELTATQAAMDKLGEREMALVAENKKFKNEIRMQLKKIGKLENREIDARTGQRIKHHVKSKDENNALRIQNNELRTKMRRLEHVNKRISEESAANRIVQRKQPLSNLDEEQRLRTKLQETHQQCNQVAQKLASFSASVMQAAGMLNCNMKDTDSPSVVLEALKQMKACLQSTQLELAGFKLQTRIAGEGQRISETQV